MATVWEFSTIGHTISAGWSLERPEECGSFSVYWHDPIASFLSALEGASLIGTGTQQLSMAMGEWSVPISKTEFARRVLQKTDAHGEGDDDAGLSHHHDNRHLFVPCVVALWLNSRATRQNLPLERRHEQ